MMRRALEIALVSGIAASIAIVRPTVSPAALQSATPSGAIATIAIRVEGEVPRPYTLSHAELRTMPRREVSASDHGAPPAKFEGVPLAAILEHAGLELGSALRGPRLAKYVVIDAADGYRVVFAIAELDSAFTNKTVLLADRVNDAPLSAEAGPARIIVSDEKRHARWIRQVSRIRVLSAPVADERSGVQVPR